MSKGKMSVSLQPNRKVDDIGTIIAKVCTKERERRRIQAGPIIFQVQDDLHHLRAAAARAGEDGADLQALDVAIARTEKGIQVHSNPQK